MTTLETLRQVVIDEAKRAAACAILLNYEHPLCLAVRALERHEARVAELERRMAAEESR
jgi:hypothetical protein